MKGLVMVYEKTMCKGCVGGWHRNYHFDRSIVIKVTVENDGACPKIRRYPIGAYKMSYTFMLLGSSFVIMHGDIKLLISISVKYALVYSRYY